jgi:hypothetical protein
MSETKERAVQKYLAFLENPEAAGQAAVEELENKFSSANTPIAKLRLLAEIDRVRIADRAAAQEGFVRHARSWATDNGIPAHAFVALGVDEGLLIEAGFEPLPKNASKLAGAKGAKSAKGSTKRSAMFPSQNRKPRAKSVNSKTVEELVLASTEPFSIRDIVDVSHATNATVSRVVGLLVAAKKVETIGALAPQGSRGTAPIGYQVKKPRKS